MRRITSLTEKETDDITDLLVRAFEDSASAIAMTGDSDEMRDLLFRSMVRAGGLAGQLYVLENESNEIVATALWFAPGTMLFSSEEQRELGYNDFMERLDDETRAWWKNEYATLSAQFVKEWLPKIPQDCWWLGALATDPKHQRKGYGTLILHECLKEMNSPNLAAFCSTSEENARFYVQAGFPVRGEMEFPSRFGNFPVFGHSRDI